MSKQPPPVPTASTTVGRPSTGSLPSTFAPPDRLPPPPPPPPARQQQGHADQTAQRHILMIEVAVRQKIFSSMQAWQRLH